MDRMVAYLTQPGQMVKSSSSMRWSKLFAPTQRETPADAEASSHQLLLRSGFIRQIGAGIYAYLPLAQRTLRKIEQIVREEIEKIGGQEFYLPALHPAELWKESGRWTSIGQTMFRLKDRSDRDLCLGMTHEEIFTFIARNEIQSYRDLPQIWYQVQVKFRDEPRPKSGLLRTRQFMMKDSYSFDATSEGLDHSYKLHDQAYRKIFDRCGLRYVAVEATSGAMGGSKSQEYMIASDAGEDRIVTCRCGYAANLECAISGIGDTLDEKNEYSLQEIHTPEQKTIQEVSKFLNIPESGQIKSLVYIFEDNPRLILLRGDHQLNETCLKRALGSDLFRLATSGEIRQLFGAEPGSLGPVGLKNIQILADHSLKDLKNLVCGANKNDYHLQNVTPERDFTAKYFDLQLVKTGDPCIHCNRPLNVTKALEVGHIFKLGYKYSESMKALIVNQKGQELPIAMGSYGIGLERVMVAAIELYHDNDGMVWPRSIAPFQVILSPLRPDDKKQLETAEAYYQQLSEHGIDVLLDDRNERPGVKFTDAELIGIPVRITIGKKLQQGIVELFSRQDKKTLEVPVEKAIEKTMAILEFYPL